MKIYTKKGDLGQTQTLGSGRVPKDDQRLHVGGLIDTCNSTVGFLCSLLPSDDPLTDNLHRIQRGLFSLGLEVTGGRQQDHMLNESDVTFLESQIDQYWDTCPPLTKFVLPGGTPSSCQAHLCRVQVRTMERSLVTLCRETNTPFDLGLQYVNRLSDYFFAIARYLNHQADMGEVTWP